MPGLLLHRIARRWFAGGPCERVFEPLIADLQHEWQEDERRRGRRAWQLFRGYGAFWLTLGLCGVRAIVRGAAAPLEIDMAMPAAIGFTVASCGLAVLRYASSSTYRHLPLDALVLGQLSTLGISVVFAMVPALMYGRRRHDRWNASATRIFAVLLAICVVCIGWTGPRLFAASMHARHPAAFNSPQPAFQSLATIVRSASSAVGEEREMSQRELQKRLAMIANAALLGLIGWRLGGIQRPSWGRALIWWFGLTELVLARGSYAINGNVWLQWRAPALLIVVLLALSTRFRSSPPALPAPPASA